MTNRFDYLVVGAGSAGCVLANRLSADPETSVLLVEAGDSDRNNPLISIPRGFGELLGDRESVWHYPTRPFGPNQQIEYWVRGKTLGGSSSVNGMVYNRGEPDDYETLRALGNDEWGWEDMLPAFRSIEAHPFGPSATRGGDGPLHLSTAGRGERLLEDVVEAGVEMGWRRVPDHNDAEGERIGFAMATIRDGRRWSAADAFLHPIADRPNLTVALGVRVARILVDDGRAIGVEVRRDGKTEEFFAAREVILCAGALATPKLLQLSGIGERTTLDAAGVRQVVDSPNVGAGMREHRVFTLQYRLTEDVGYNRLLATSEGRQQSMARYEAQRDGPMAAPSFDLVGFFKTRPELKRPDAQIQVAPISMLPPQPGRGIEIERDPGLLCIAYMLRPTSKGAVRITSSEPDADLDIEPGYLITDHDRQTTVDIVRSVRRFFATSALEKWIEHETAPGVEVQTSQEIIDAGLRTGSAGYHAIGTAAMGPDDDDVVDTRLRVRGVSGLRIMDASVLPTMVSGNLNGPIMAMAWRAGDLILDEA